MAYYHNKYWKDIGNRIKDIRKRRGVTQDVMAALVGISRASYSKVENGHRLVTAIEIDMICRALQVKANDIINVVKDDPR